jgi:hypothetical protein
MFENIEGKNAIKTRIAKGEMMGVAHHISVFENLVLKFDTIRIFLRGCARTDVEDKFIALPEDCFEISADWIRDMIGSDCKCIFLDKDRHLILQSVGNTAAFALELAPPRTQCRVTGRTANNVGNVFIHSICLDATLAVFAEAPDRYDEIWDATVVFVLLSLLSAGRDARQAAVRVQEWAIGEE